ncbi:hypothetical protein GJAV_G00119960 [Gymnothorax javanicus]|nr:hypothetical protein GJAV_G00119960 [Gymnothorax javanicus]
MFILNYSPRDGGDTLEVTLEGSKTQATLSGLQPSTEYAVTLITVQGDVTYEPVTGSAVTGMDPPRDVTVSFVTEDSITISWSHPIAQFDHYKMSYQSAQGRLDGMVIDSDVTNYTLTSLYPATEYDISLNAVRSGQESEVITTSVFTVAADTILVEGSRQEHQLSQLHPSTSYSVALYATKGPLTSGTVIANFATRDESRKERWILQVHRSALISWQPPIADIDNYMLTYKSADGNRKELILDAEDTWIRLEALAEITEYTVRLQAARGMETSAIVSTVFSTGNRLFATPQNSAESTPYTSTETPARECWCTAT